MRVSLEMELANEAAWKAYRMTNGSEDRSLPSRKELLDFHRDILRKFQHNPCQAETEKMAAVLEQMVKEDAAHAPLSDEALAKLPLQERARELIYRLRDVGYSRNFRAPRLENDTAKDTVEQLCLIGYDAVPLLIEALEDERPTRSVHDPEHPCMVPPAVMTVGEYAEEILETISGQIFARNVTRYTEPPPAETRKLLAAVKEDASAWWKAHAESEKDALVKEVSAGKLPPGVIERLKLKYPEALEGALLAGAAKANVKNARETDGGVWLENDYLRLLGELKTQAATDYLVHQLTKGLWGITRAQAAEQLWKGRHPAVIPAVMRDWKELQANPSHSIYDEPGSFARFMIETGQNDAITALTSEADHLSAEERCRLVLNLGEYHFRKRLHPELWGPAEPAALETEEAFLVQELGDAALNFWAMGKEREDPTVFESPRICDYALWSLHQLDPQRYACANQAGRKQRELERMAAANAWRKEHHEPALEIPDLDLPPLPVSESLKITSVLTHPPIMDHPLVFLRRALALKGQKFSRETLARVMEDFKGEPGSGVKGVAVEAVREDDLSGVRLNITMDSGSAPDKPWKIYEFLYIDGKSFSPERKVNDPPGPPQDEGWRVLMDGSAKAIDAEPHTPFSFTVTCYKRDW